MSSYGVANPTALRPMPSSRRKMGQRVQVATGSRKVPTERGNTHYDNVRGPETFGIRNAQRPLVNNPKRQVRSAIRDMEGGLLYGSSRQPKRMRVFDVAESAKRRRIDELAPQQLAPQIGVFTPDLTMRAKDSEDLTFNAGFPGVEAADDFHRGITPASRPAGTNIAWGNMPMVPDSMFHQGYRNNNGNRPALPGTASDNLFIQLGDSQAPSSVSNPFIGKTYNAAAGAKFETRDSTGTPNARTKYTHYLTEASEDFAPEEQRYMPWFVPTEQASKRFRDPVDEFSTRAWQVPQHDGFSLVGVNMALAVAQPSPETPDQVVTPQIVLSQYAFCGTVVSDPGAKVSPQAAHLTNHKRRFITYQPSGPAPIFNLWGRVNMFDRVYLLVKGIDKSEIRGHHGAPSGSFNLSATTPAASQQVSAQSYSSRTPVPVADTVVQFVPWSSPQGQRGPSYEDVCYVDDFGIERVGAVIFLGTVMQIHGESTQSGPMDTPHTRGIAPFSTFATHQLNQIRVHLRPQIVSHS